MMLALDTHRPLPGPGFLARMGELVDGHGGGEDPWRAPARRPGGLASRRRAPAAEGLKFAPALHARELLTLAGARSHERHRHQRVRGRGGHPRRGLRRPRRAVRPGAWSTSRTTWPPRWADCRALLVRNRTQVRGALLEAAPKLVVVGRLGVGLDNIDLEACKARGVAGTPRHCRAANDLSVAEYVITAALMLLRWRAWFATDRVAAGTWPRMAP